MLFDPLVVTMHRFSLALACLVLGCSTAHNNRRYCAEAVSTRPNDADLVCAPGEELVREETEAMAMQRCLAPNTDAVCAEGNERSPNGMPPWMLEHCRASAATQSLYIEYSNEGVRFLERTTRTDGRFEVDLVTECGLGNGHASFPASCAHGRAACGPGRVDYAESGVTGFSGAYGAQGHPDGRWVVRRGSEEAQFSLEDGNGTMRDILGIEQMTCKNGLVDGLLRVRGKSEGQMDVVVEAQFQDGRAHGTFHTTLNTGTTTYDLVMGQYTQGVPTGRWVIESHGDECAHEEGDCAVVCVDYVRNGPALYEYRENDHRFVRDQREVTEPFRSMQRIQSAPFSAEERAEPSPFRILISGSATSCMDVIRAVAELPSPGIQMEFLRDQQGGAQELVNILHSRP